MTKRLCQLQTSDCASNRTHQLLSANLETFLPSETVDSLLLRDPATVQVPPASRIALDPCHCISGFFFKSVFRLKCRTSTGPYRGQISKPPRRAGHHECRQGHSWQSWARNDKLDAESESTGVEAFANGGGRLSSQVQVTGKCHGHGTQSVTSSSQSSSPTAAARQS